jgi:hypothetical protein
VEADSSSVIVVVMLFAAAVLSMSAAAVVGSTELTLLTAVGLALSYSMAAAVRTFVKPMVCLTKRPRALMSFYHHCHYSTKSACYNCSR